MIGYRFLYPAEEEMTEASLFYEAASLGLGNNFLDDVQRVVDSLREHPYLGTELIATCGGCFCPLSLQPDLFNRG